ncbi:hypothetical protein [Zavarzinella formosa]|uniref:hypothetical protein n=1 Tax=Zavarzinella formosa TaxID=360055 RepID=UPI0002E66571|nr:hypothetical protein [Zavarzinella formosa]
MPKVTLTEYECRNDLLPMVCLKCGAIANTTVRRQFSWYPSWVIWLAFLGLMIALVAGVIMTKRMVIESPMCDRHQGHWANRKLWTWLALGFLAVLLIVGIELYSEAHQQQDKDFFATLIWGGGATLLVAWLAFALVLRIGMIKPKIITSQTITLLNIHPEFVRALKQERERDAEAERQSRARRPANKGRNRPSSKNRKNER